MRKSNQILQNFFGKINDDFILNTLYVLQLILNVAAHKKRLEEILKINNANISLDELTIAVTDEIQYYKGLQETDSKYFMEEILTGKAINVIKVTPIIWSFISLYWACDFKNKTHDEILEIYNPNIGDIALKFLLYFKKMKVKEDQNVSIPHKSSFYEDLSARLVRIIDILPVMSKLNNDHLNKLYLPVSNQDYAQNFLQVQIENPWEQAVLSVKEIKSGKNIIRYEHNGENIDLSITPSRMTKDGAFRDLDKTYSQLMQLQNLDLATASSRYNLCRKRKSSKKKVVLVVSELEKELIYDEALIDAEIINSEDKIEQKSKRKTYRRDTKDISTQDEEDSKKTEEYITPNAFQQHKRNVAYSEALAKQKLLLESDYSIPPIPHLRAFIASLHEEESLDSKIYTGFFILNVSLGCSYDSVMHILLEKKQESLQLKNNVMTVDLDTSLFASNYSTLLVESDNKLQFNIPITMSILIVRLKKTFLNDEFNEEEFLAGYKKFLKSSVKKFPKKIIIKEMNLHRYLAQYVQKNAKDVLTSKFATVAYSQNDTAKLAYTSSRSNTVEHSQLIRNYWYTLDLNTVACDILDISNNYPTHTTSISSENYSGTSQSVEIDIAKDFFQILREKIYDCDEDEVLYFNLVTIYTRFAMSLLAGTRPFLESGNFDSYDEEVSLWVISEKSQDIASGTRMVPLCDTINNLLINYKKLLSDRGLKNNFYLLAADKYVKFRAYEAHKILKRTLNLEDDDILQQYIMNVPLNSGRHLFTKVAIDSLVNSYYISTYLGHYTAGEEQLGRYSTLDVLQYCKAIKKTTTKIAIDCGIKEL